MINYYGKCTLIMSQESHDTFYFAFYHNESFAHVVFGERTANRIANFATNVYVMIFSVGLVLTAQFSVFWPKFQKCADLWQWQDCSDDLVLRVVCYNLVVRILVFTPWVMSFALLWNKAATLLILKTFDWWFKQICVATTYICDLCVIYQSDGIESHRGLLLFDRFVLFVAMMISNGLVSSFDALNPDVVSWKVQGILIFVMISICGTWYFVLQYHLHFHEDMAAPHTIHISSYFGFSLWEAKRTAWLNLCIFYIKQFFWKVVRGHKQEIQAVFSYSPNIVWLQRREQSTPKSMHIIDPLTRQMSFENENKVVPV